MHIIGADVRFVQSLQSVIEFFKGKPLDLSLIHSSADAETIVHETFHYLSQILKSPDLNGNMLAKRAYYRLMDNYRKELLHRYEPVNYNCLLYTSVPEGSAAGETMMTPVPAYGAADGTMMTPVSADGVADGTMMTPVSVDGAGVTEMAITLLPDGGTADMHAEDTATEPVYTGVMARGRKQEQFEEGGRAPFAYLEEEQNLNFPAFSAETVDEDAPLTSRCV